MRVRAPLLTNSASLAGKPEFVRSRSPGGGAWCRRRRGDAGAEGAAEMRCRRRGRSRAVSLGGSQTSGCPVIGSSSNVRRRRRGGRGSRTARSANRRSWRRSRRCGGSFQLSCTNFGHRTQVGQRVVDRVLLGPRRDHQQRQPRTVAATSALAVERRVARRCRRTGRVPVRKSCGPGGVATDAVFDVL